MTSPQTDAEWLDLLRRLNPGGPEPEVISDPERSEAYLLPDDDPSAELDVGRPEAHRGGTTDAPAQPPGLLILIAAEFAADVAAIWTGDSMADYLMATECQRHVWHCWLASAFAGLMRRAKVDAARPRRHLATRRAKDLLRDVYGDCPPGLIAALGKCGAQARSRDFYPALVQALARRDLGAKHIRHSRKMTDLGVMSIAALPSELQFKPLFAKLCTGGFEEEYFAQACWTTKRLADLGPPGVVSRVLRSSEPMVAMSEAVARLPFPEPPWPGTDRLRPITSVEALRTAGARLGNCLRDKSTEYAIKVAAGSSYYYEWSGDGDDAGIVTFESVRPLGWVVEDGHARGNDPIGPSAWSGIQAALTTWADLAPPWVSQRGVPQGAAFFKARLF